MTTFAILDSRGRPVARTNRPDAADLLLQAGYDLEPVDQLPGYHGRGLVEAVVASLPPLHRFLRDIFPDVA